MTDPKKPEADATIVSMVRESTEDRSDEPQEAPEDPGLQTVVVPPPKAEPSKGTVEGKAPADPVSRRAAEKSVKNEHAARSPVEHPPETPPGKQKAVPEKKGGHAGLFLGVILLLAVGAGAFFVVRQANQGSGWSQWLPFKWGAGQRQESAQNVPVQNVPVQNVPVQNVPVQNVPDVPAGSQGTLPEPLARHEWVQAGMPAQIVRDIMGDPLRVGTVGQILQWEYDTGTELIIVRFQDNKVYDKNMVPYPSIVDNRAPELPSTSTPVQVPELPQTAQAPTLPAIPEPAAGTENVQALPQQDSGAPRYDQIQTGMSSDAVSGILGEPSEVKKVGRAIEWEYDTGTGYFEVRFQRGKVVFKGMSSYHTPTPAQTSPPTTVPPSSTQVPPGPPVEVVPAPSDYDRITVGMTPEAVTQILGKPSLVKKLRTSIEWEYETPQGTFEVRFRNKRVSFRGMEPHPGKTGATAPPASSAPGTGVLSPAGGGAN